MAFFVIDKNLAGCRLRSFDKCSFAGPRICSQQNEEGPYGRHPKYRRQVSLFDSIDGLLCTAALHLLLIMQWKIWPCALPKASPGSCRHLIVEYY